MDLTKSSRENIEYMLNEIITKLRMVNIGAIKSDSLDEERYEELQEIYELVMKKNSFSPNEMQALAEELGQLRRA
ncbi:DUF1128 domain-containing protein [Bacillus sp. FJAT-50079]|uniref:DUF1128 domain-containing protein n=1 Tax=Bacillus sp. FJAT-50079 TaxID=2833577 RepID=UPI001BC954F9|nr:DUF1128 domain-containing protein [Bacillus sp. FJAT-50079]MBS4209185.1 DUF1128 domain-containing protein [Bacillus sp. FJAT-50079]